MSDGPAATPRHSPSYDDLRALTSRLTSGGGAISSAEASAIQELLAAYTALVNQLRDEVAGTSEHVNRAHAAVDEVLRFLATERGASPTEP